MGRYRRHRCLTLPLAGEPWRRREQPQRRNLAGPQFDWINRSLTHSIDPTIDPKSRRALPIRPRLLPDEALSTFVARIAIRIGVSENDLMRHLRPGKRFQLRDLDCRYDSQLLKVLVQETQATREQLLSLIFSYGAPDTPVTSLLGTWPRGFPKSFPEPGWMQFCPRCLGADRRPYFRRRWRLATSTSCLEHKCLLLDRCPHCQKPLSEAVLTFTCCGRKLADAPVLPVSPYGVANEARYSRELITFRAKPGANREDEILSRQLHAMFDVFDEGLAPVEGPLFPIYLMWPIERHSLQAAVALQTGDEPDADTEKTMTHEQWLHSACPQIRLLHARRRHADYLRRLANKIHFGQQPRIPSRARVSMGQHVEGHSLRF